MDNPPAQRQPERGGTATRRLPWGFRHGLRRVVPVARTPKPWFRTERAVWCVHFPGQMHQLGAHPDGFPAPRQSKGKWNVPPPIMQAFHTLLATPPDTNPTAAPAASRPAPAVLTVPDVVDSFLEWCEKSVNVGVQSRFTNAGVL